MLRKLVNKVDFDASGLQDRPVRELFHPAGVGQHRASRCISIEGLAVETPG
uniref:AraC family transcriptional regulator n=1 Tax=Macrostomum lignano TaxID=282301 RepID=A0A1I8FRK4_9PLAT